jgi:hypothetical protein
MKLAPAARTILTLSATWLALAACGDDTASSSSASSGGTGGSGGAGGAGGSAPPAETEGCDGAKLLTSPVDTAERGPWLVGARTVQVGSLVAEVWYPARSSEGDAPGPKTYDVRQWLPDSEVDKIPLELAPIQTCDCYADLPIDEAHGPYPVIVFVHGTAGFRTQSLELVQHWASRGFVVLAADHPGLYLKDLLAGVCTGMFPEQRDLGPDLDTLVAALNAPSGDLAFLEGFVDASRLGMAGHSAGGSAIANRGDEARVLVPMASRGTSEGTALVSTLVLGAQDDAVVPYGQTKAGFDASPSPKRLVGISPAGHLTFSSLCAIENSDGQDIVEIGTARDVCGLGLAGALFDCEDSYLEASLGWTISNEAASAAFEEVLHCKPERGEVFGGLQARYPEVVEVVETP